MTIDVESGVKPYRIWILFVHLSADDIYLDYPLQINYLYIVFTHYNTLNVS